MIETLPRDEGHGSLTSVMMYPAGYTTETNTSATTGRNTQADF